MTLLLGATLTQLALEARQRLHTNSARTALAALPVAILLALSATMFYVQRQTFPASEHLEFPWLAQQQSQPLGPGLPLVPRPHPTRRPLRPRHQVRQRGWRRRPDLPPHRPPQRSPRLLQGRWRGRHHPLPRRPMAARRRRPDSTSPPNPTPSATRVYSPSASPGWSSTPSAPTAHPCPYNNGVIKVCSLAPARP